MGKLYGLIGYPIGHSMSPLMHNNEFSQLEMPNYYQAFNVEPSQLEHAVTGMRALGISGFNVTIPHKVAVMDFLDVIDEEAASIGAVNTIVNHDGQLIGYNTDGQGYLQSLLTITGESLQGKSILVIGAGGAARAIVTSIARHGVKTIDITNRTSEKAEEMSKHALKFATSKSLTLQQAEEALNEYDVVINTTSVGMSPNVDDIPLSLHNLREGTILSDLIYNPLKTKWLTIGEEKGAIIDNGVSMFVGQGALSFKKWTGVEPNQARMKKIVEETLGGR
ncbi:shikimate dehydrogenase [Bacillus taeanensis]|uniref:Shikimate dehydrogenase (NADP(+)) n=1 Tax=Bacillus taeanensis TaxID=273032 RepID=A0A366XXV3_9BACI|nr:shikimate dehydrogenase [Bacillus taeanensis]RBW70476.1 shikimate dehydrogenase [Bacillus taeanensis]